jgi:COP9 signalosome complex subunit 5
MHSKIHDRKELYLGWYHSHPGYRVFLGGIDIMTQRIQQQQGATLAVVIDPIKTVQNGKVEIAGFRTYKEDYKSEKEYDIFETGVYGNQYYRIPNFEIYRSETDYNLLQLLWNKYWNNTFSKNALNFNKEYHNSIMKNIYSNLEKIENDLDKNNSKIKENINKINNDCIELGTDILKGLSTNVLKDILFN